MRLNDDQTADQTEPTKPLDPARFKWRKVRYLPHQNVREAARRLKQISRQQLAGSAVSPEARETAERLRLAVAITNAEASCHDYVNEAIEAGDEDRLPGRDHLLVAVIDLARWLRGEAPIETASTSVMLGASGLRGDDLAA